MGVTIFVGAFTFAADDGFLVEVAFLLDVAFFVEAAFSTSDLCVCFRLRLPAALWAGVWPCLWTVVVVCLAALSSKMGAGKLVAGSCDVAETEESSASG